MWNPIAPPKLRTYQVPLPVRDVHVQAAGTGGFQFRWHDGEKFAGGFGATQVLTVDYWTLRLRSAQLFRQNLYARGIIRRLTTNVVNTGLNLEATPEEAILGIPEDGLADWTEDVENRFRLWEQDPTQCDYSERRTFGQLQAEAFAEARICGDVLVVERQNPFTGLPKIQLISAWLVQTPYGVTPQRGNKIVHGVELDAQKRHVAYWVAQEDGTSKRLPAYGEKTGRRIAFLLYGGDRRLDDVRGEPILSIALQSLKEIDRYRDAAQRKAIINSMLALFIKKSADKAGTRPFAGSATVRNTLTTVANDGTPRAFRTAEQIPGLVLDELQHGEEPHGFQPHGVDEKFGDFERAIVQSIAWALEIPPEILTLSFSSNYSASQAAINEFKMYLNVERTRLGDDLCTPIYQEWLRASALAGTVKADGFIEALRDPKLHAVYGAWTSCDWAGHIKPAVDLSKLVKGYELMVAMGAITRDRMARELTGTKYSKNVKKLARENQQLADANKPLVELEKPPAPTAPPPGDGGADDDGADEEEAASKLRRIA